MVGYFSHDINASRDPKLVRLRMKHKWEGYGLYWALIEKLSETSGYKLPLDLEVLSFDLRADAGILKSIINDFGLFVCTPKDEYGCVYFYSESLLKRMEIKDAVSEKRREAGRKRWSKQDEEESKSTTVVEQKLSKCTANAKQVLNNKIKENKRKENNISSNDDIKKEEPSPSPSLNDFGPMDRMFSLDELLFRLQSDDSWHTAVYEREKLAKESVPEMIKVFISELRAQGVGCKAERDAKQHFLNWYRIHKKTLKNEPQAESGAGYRPNPKRYTGTGTQENSYNTVGTINRRTN